MELPLVTKPTATRKVPFVALLGILLVAGFMATTLISYQVARQSLEEHIADEMLPLTSDNIYSEIQRDLLRPILISSLMANDTFVRDWAIGGEGDSLQIRNYLGEIQKKYATITAFYVSDNTLNYYHPDGLIKTMDRADPEDDWYFRLRTLSTAYDINVDSDTANRSRLNIFINYRVLDYSGRFIGVTGVGLSVNSVIALIDNYQKRYNRRIYFVDREGNIRLHGQGFEPTARLHQRPGLATLATQILTTPSMSTTYRRDDGEEIYLNSRLVPEFDWYLVVEQQRDAGQQRIDRTLLINILVSLAITALVLVISHYTLRGYQRKLVAMATTDKLSGALNRQAFENLFEHAVKLARRRGHPLSLLAIDLDQFKLVNDHYGHQGGDLAIHSVAALLQEYSRESDSLCRWGGDEFMLLMEHCSLAEAGGRADEIRLRVSNWSVPFGRDRISVTISIGVAEYQPGESLDALITRADNALYTAKGDGRDRVVVG